MKFTESEIKVILKELDRRINMLEKKDEKVYSKRIKQIKSTQNKLYKMLEELRDDCRED